MPWGTTAHSCELCSHKDGEEAEPGSRLLSRTSSHPNPGEMRMYATNPGAAMRPRCRSFGITATTFCEFYKQTEERNIQGFCALAQGVEARTHWLRSTWPNRVIDTSGSAASRIRLRQQSFRKSRSIIHTKSSWPLVNTPAEPTPNHLVCLEPSYSYGIVEV